jgi:Na+/melibiose symporter-like transporter
MSNNNTNNGGIGLPMVLFLIFLVLKLTDNIDWSWWWVTCPLWIVFIWFIVIIVTLVGSEVVEEQKAKHGMKKWAKKMRKVEEEEDPMSE